MTTRNARSVSIPASSAGSSVRWTVSKATTCSRPAPLSWAAVSGSAASLPARRPYILVDSIDDAVKKVVELGGTITTPKDEIPGMGWYAAGTDSEGNTLALYETAPKG